MVNRELDEREKELIAKIDAAHNNYVDAPEFGWDKRMIRVDLDMLEDMLYEYRQNKLDKVKQRGV